MKMNLAGSSAGVLVPVLGVTLLISSMALSASKHVNPTQTAWKKADSSHRIHTDQDATLVLLHALDAPVITVATPGAEGNQYGFEGGRVVKIGETYHLTTTEMTGEPRFVKTKLGYWTSQDRIHWQRRATLFDSTADMSGEDVRASLWAPMPVFNQGSDRWELFYVGYRAMPEDAPYPPKNDSSETGPYLEHPDPQHRNPNIYYNYGGVIWRAISETKGVQGIGGPYKDAGIILKPGMKSQPWEGIQGTDSFFPFKAKDRWLGFYGSCHCESLPVKGWQVGLASAPSLGGPWTRLASGNPVALDPTFVENPVVTKIRDGLYIAVYNGPDADSFGYATSSDGIHWNPGKKLKILGERVHWARRIRTPLGLIPEGNNEYTLFYTGFTAHGAKSPFQGRFSSAVGVVTLRLQSGV